MKSKKHVKADLGLLTFLALVLVLCFSASAWASGRVKFTVMDGYGNRYGSYMDMGTCRMMAQSVLDGFCVVEEG